MSSAIIIDRTRFASFILQWAIYVLFVAFFVAALCTLVSKRGRTRVILLLVVVSMFLVATASTVINFAPALHSSNTSDAPILVTADKSSVLGIEVTGFIQVLLGDSFLIYRCYVIWSTSWKVVVTPVLLTIGFVVGAVGTTVLIAEAEIPEAIVFGSLRPWWISTIVCTFRTNALCTALISYRLYTSGRELKLYGQFARRSHIALVIIVESAAIYLAVMTVYLALTLRASFVAYIVGDVLPSVIGIIFTAIIIRMSLGLSKDSTVSFHSSHQVRQIMTIGGTRRLVTDDYEMGTVTRPLAVHVDQFVEVDSMDGKNHARKETG